VGWEAGDGCPSAKDVLVRRLRLSPGHATRLLKTAQALREDQFASTADAFAAGLIGAEHPRPGSSAVVLTAAQFSLATNLEYLKTSFDRDVAWTAGRRAPGGAGAG
jgi:hypothetical protein